MKKLTIEDLNRITPEEFKQTKKIPLVVVLDNVRSMHNVGAVFRTADAFIVEKIVLCGITSCPPNAEIHKSALGAEMTVDWEYAEDTLDAVRQLKKQGYHVYSIEQVERSEMLNDLSLPEGKPGFAIVMGNEVKGVRQDVVDESDGVIEIPQFGTKHSLNVSVTAGIVMWELFKRIKLC